MKHLFYTIAILSLTLSCNKKADEATTETVENTTTETKTPSTANNAIVVPKEVSFADLKTKMGDQKNDTTYVYNFFATWCGPCMKEIPHFKEKMEETKAEPIKFVFVSIDEKATWDTDLQNFANEHNLGKSIVKYDFATGPQDFAKQITKTWDGGSIPFTMVRKGEKTTEIIGGISKEELNTKIKEVQ